MMWEKAGLGMRQAARVAFVATGLLVGLAASTALAAAETSPIAEPLSPEQKELARLRDFLAGPDRTLATRRDAADVLIDKGSDEARRILIDVLAAPAEPALAVLEALAAREDADDAFVEPLFSLLRAADEPMRQAAARAFGPFHGNERVQSGLRDLIVAPDVETPVRLAAVDAIAQAVDRTAIDTLVQAAGGDQPEVAAAAAQALAEMTGIRTFAASPDAWKTWWEHHKDQPIDRLLGSLLRRSRQTIRRHETRLDRLQSRLMGLLDELYQGADARQKGALAQSHLDDALPEVRAVAARQARALAREVLAANGGGQNAYRDLIASLLTHVADESPTVRAAAAEALAAWQETAAGPALLARLDTERVPDVRAALASALGSVRVVEAVPVLVKMLASPHEAEVVKAAGAIGLIGDPSNAGAAPIEPAVEPLSNLARAAASPAVREAACRALGRIAQPAGESVLVAALGDGAPEVRFSAAQGLGLLPRVAPEAVGALTDRLQDPNKGVRQAVAAALAKLGGPETAHAMADRLQPNAETEPAVRNALWAAVQALVKRNDAPDLAIQLGDAFFAREGLEAMQHAAALYETALALRPPNANEGQKTRTLLEKLVDACIAAGVPRKAVPALRQLLQDTPPENEVRRRELTQQLGFILLAVEPYTEAAGLLAQAMGGLDAGGRLPLVKAIQGRAETLLKDEDPTHALDLLEAFRQARPDWGDAGLNAYFEALLDRARRGAAGQAIASLNGSDQQTAAAIATLKKLGPGTVGPLLDALETAARENQAGRETNLLAALEAVTGRSDHNYHTDAPLEERLEAIKALRRRNPPPPTESDAAPHDADPPKAP